MYADNGKTFIISKVKMADVVSMRSKGGTVLLEFFMEYADLVFDEEKDIPFCVLDVVGTGRKKRDRDLGKKEEYITSWHMYSWLPILCYVFDNA